MSIDNIADNIQHYTAVLRDLQAQKEEIDTQIVWIELRLDNLKKLLPARIEVIPKESTPTVAPETRKPFQPLSPGHSLADQCYLVLEESGEPLHASVIKEKLLEYKRDTSVKSITGVMPQDKKKRFENLGNNIWALVKWSEALKRRFRTPKIVVHK